MMYFYILHIRIMQLEFTKQNKKQKTKKKQTNISMLCHEAENFDVVNATKILFESALLKQ